MILPAFFDLKLHKWENFEKETIELFARLWTLPLSVEQGSPLLKNF